jgi:glycosyltransferase involved in cell wall biosynthesis
MKISLIGPVYPFRGGIPRVTGLLVQHLEREGHQVQVLSFRRLFPRWLYPGQSDRDPSQHTPLPQARYILDSLWPGSWGQAVHLIQQFQPDVVICTWWTTFLAPLYWWVGSRLRREKTRVGFMIHNVIPHEARFYDRFLARQALGRGEAYLVFSEREKARLQQLISLPSQLIFTTPLPVFSPEQSLISKETARTRLGLPDNAPVLLFFGLVRPYKGLHSLIEALSILSHKGLHPILLVAGEIWGDPLEYHTQVRQLNLADQVRFYNRYIPDEETPLFFGAADLFIAPYLGGTQSASIRLAMGHHTPVLASDQIAGDLPAAIPTFPAGDAQALASQIEQCLKQPPGVTDQYIPADWANLSMFLDQMTAAPKPTPVARTEPR